MTDKLSTVKANIKTNHGTISVNLLSEAAPITVKNFVSLSQKGFYDGVIFHRVIENFMIQGGDPTGTGTGGPGYEFEDEITKEQTFNSSGILAMANAGPNTNGSQFFITTVPTPHLNGNHTIFGIVVKGYDVVEKISRVQTTEFNDKPIEDVIIETIEIKED
tara:strand:+ start:232 stop:717 length:486 start_codon:yes stop_codon:yes gene_type:complete